jgi:nucleotide-binding universal stress UspA family protein
VDAQIAAARSRLTVVVAALAATGVTAAAAVVSGLPAPAIVDHARAGGFDLLVMGTHGRTGLSHLVVGSVAERVLRSAPCPVLTVKAGEQRGGTRLEASAAALAG